MSSFTAGPWFIAGRGPNKELFCDAGTIAELNLTRLDEDGANARLIAAAPELLEALKDAESELACQPRINSYVIDKVRAAIAKATGEQA